MFLSQNFNKNSCLNIGKFADKLDYFTVGFHMLIILTFFLIKALFSSRALHDIYIEKANLGGGVIH